MQEQPQTEYLFQLQKLLTSQISSVLWSPTMDILLILTYDNILQAYRISFKAQRFFHIQQNQAITHIVFSPDSQFVVYGLLDGGVRIVRVENGERVMAVQGIGSGIGGLSFGGFGTLGVEEFMPFMKNSVQSKLIQHISPHKNCNKNAIIKINYFNELKDNFTCLLLTEGNKIWLLLNGFVTIGCLDISKTLSSLPLPSNSQTQILHTYLDLTSTQKLFSILSTQTPQTLSLSLLTFDAEPLLTLRSDIIKYNCLMTNITEILNFLDGTYTALEVNIRDIIRQYNSKINLIDDSSMADIVPREELLQYLSIGLTSATLMNFFTKQIYDTKVLQKLDETLTQLFSNLHDILIQSVQNSLQKATILLLKLLSYSQVQKYEQFGIKTSEFRQIEQSLIRLYTLGQMLLVESTETKFNIRNLLIWLNKASIKTCQENQAEIENSKSYLNRYTVDYTRLYGFLSQQERFRMGNLLRFFRKGQEKQGMGITQPDFKMLSKTNKKPQPPSKSQLDVYANLCLQLSVSQDPLPQRCPMSSPSQQTFNSFKHELTLLSQKWKQLSLRPSHHIGHKLSLRPTFTPISSLPTPSQLFPFNPYFHLAPSPCPLSSIPPSLSLSPLDCISHSLQLYYVDNTSNQNCDILVRYNCTNQTLNRLYCSKWEIVGMGVGGEVILLLEERGMGERANGQGRIIASVGNEKWDGELELGRKISRLDQGDIIIGAGMRGLNAIVVGKSKLVIFD